MKNRIAYTQIAAALLLGLAALPADAQRAEAPATEIKRTLDGQTFTFVRYADERGRVHE